MVTTTTNSTTIPMTMAQAREHVQEVEGYPVVLREAGTVAITCPYCGESHEHPPEPGHYAAGCDDNIRDTIQLTVGDRTFIPNYGYGIREYVVTPDGVYTIT